MATNRQYDPCPTDGFPMIDYLGAIVCSAERADELIGGQRVVDASISNGYLYLIFAKGTQMPLTCPCCGGQLHLRNISLEHLSHLLSGRTVEGFRHGEWVSNDDPPQRHPIFAIQFSGEEDASARTIQIHLDSVRQITESSTDVNYGHVSP
jgi:hypothetical protein